MAGTFTCNEVTFLAKVSTFTPLLSLAPAAIQVGLLHGTTVLLQGANRFTTGQHLTMMRYAAARMLVLEQNHVVGIETHGSRKLRQHRIIKSTGEKRSCGSKNQM